MDEKRKDAAPVLAASASWEALCVRAAGWIGIGAAPGLISDDEARVAAREWPYQTNEQGKIAALALFARGMSILTRPS